MKKLMVLVVMLTLLAGSAFALTIVNSKHDLSTDSTTAIKSTSYDEVCVFCHTPHAADLSVTLAPLWNRSHMGADLLDTQLYNSATLETSSQPTQVVDNINDSDALLCLSCHDGSLLDSGLVNPLNKAPINGADPLFDAGNNTVGADADLIDGEFLRNDHPIGMNYTSSAATDTGLHPQATVEASIVVNFYNDIMWCSSCHDVHDNAYAPFLVMDNAGSDLCLTCHDK